MIRLLNKILYILIPIYIILISVDPGDVVLGLKMPLFVLIIGISILNLIINKESIPNVILLTLFTVILLPIISFCYCLSIGSVEDYAYALGHCKSFLFLLFFFAIIVVDFEYVLKIICISGTILSVITVVLYVIVSIESPLFNLVYQYVTSNEIAMLSVREYYGISITGVYMKTGPLIFLSYTYVLYFMKKCKWRKILILINCFALLVAGSRVPMLMGLALTLIYIARNIKFSKKVKTFISFIFCIGILLLIYIFASEVSEASNQVKYGNAYSYLVNITKGLTPMFGAGLGSVFWANGNEAYISYSELTYFDILRIYGIPAGCILILFIFYPLLEYIRSHRLLSEKYKYFIIAYSAYMILAGTNPVLICSTGMFVYSLGLAFIYNIKKGKIVLSNDKYLYSNV